VLTGPAAGSSTTDTRPTFTGTAEPGSTVTVRVDGVAVCTATADSSGNFACTSTSELPRGDHQATAIAVDPAGNTSQPSSPVGFSVVAVTPPAPHITSPAQGLVTNDATPTLSGTATAGATVTVREESTGAVLCTTTANTAGEWSCDSTLLTDGTHAVTATATVDGAESQPSSARSFRVDTTPPQVDITGTPIEPISTATTTTLTWQTEPETTYECSIDGGPYQSCTNPLSLTGLSEGEHRVSVRATDEAGNTYVTSTTWLVADQPIDWYLSGSGVSCGAVPLGAWGPLGVLLLALRRRRR
jgi:uncharacterized protein (TIGR03382 family)